MDEDAPHERAADEGVVASLVHDDVRYEVARRCAAGHACVLRCHPVRGALIDPLPFPTLWWLVCPRAIEAVSRLEHGGAIGRFEERLAADSEATTIYRADHRAYGEERANCLSDEERRRLAELGRLDALLQRGIGGIADLRRIKCLHLHYAHHLMRGSLVGRWIEAEWAEGPCR